MELLPSLLRTHNRFLKCKEFIIVNRPLGLVEGGIAVALVKHRKINKLYLTYCLIIFLLFYLFLEHVFYLILYYYHI